MNGAGGSETSSKPDRWSGLITLLALAAVLLHPTQASFDLLAATERAHLNLCLVDLVIWAAFALWALQRIRRKDFIRLPIPVAAVLGAVWLALSLIPQLKGATAGQIQVSRAGLIKVVQFAEYFIAGYIIFVETFRKEKRRRQALALLSLAVVSAVALAWVQYLSAAVGVTDVRGTWFDNRNTFGMFLALALPLLFGVAAFGRSCVLYAGMLILAAAALCVCLSGGAFLALCLGLLVVAFLRGRFTFVVAALALLLLITFALPHLRRPNSDVLLDSVMLYRESDPHRIFHDDIERIRRNMGEKQSRLARTIAEKRPVSRSELFSEQDYAWRWRQRYAEWQAALNMIRLSPIFGVGAGSYQANVNRFYDMPKYPVNLLEPDTLNGYLVWGASAGIPFLLILLAMFLTAARSAGRCFRISSDGDERGLAAGIMGSLVALAAMGVFSNPLVRGVGVSVALILALAATMRAGASPAAKVNLPSREGVS